MRGRPLSLAIAGVVLTGALAVVAGDDLLVLMAERTTLSRTATDRDCPEVTDELPPRALAPGTLRLRGIVRGDQPTSASFAPDGSGDGVLSQRGGQVYRIEAGEVQNEIVLDLSGNVLGEGDGGLLALDYDPDGEWLYLLRTDADRDDVVTAYPLDADGRPELSGEREIIRSAHPPSIQHHGGAFGFGADGMLYMGFGDGGGLGDPRENADNLEVVLGKVLRIDPTPEADDPYRIPPDNPFVGDDGAAPEIWVYGVRNPFRLGIDSQNDDLWLGDVGQSCWEELNRLQPGAGGSNLGWDRKEGSHAFEGGAVPGPEVEPTFEINHRHGWCSIVAGVVVRDPAVPSLDGQLLFTDYCKGQIWLLDVDASEVGDPVVIDSGLRVERPIAIVEGPNGLPWVLTLDGEVLEVRPTD